MWDSPQDSLSSFLFFNKSFFLLWGQVLLIALARVPSRPHLVTHLARSSQVRGTAVQLGLPSSRASHSLRTFRTKSSLFSIFKRFPTWTSSLRSRYAKSSHWLRSNLVIHLMIRRSWPSGFSRTINCVNVGLSATSNGTKEKNYQLQWSHKHAHYAHMRTHTHTHTHTHMQRRWNGFIGEGAD